MENKIDIIPSKFYKLKVKIYKTNLEGRIIGHLALF